MSAKNSARVVMVKKLLANGEPCKKCGQAEDMLRRRDLWDMVDEVVFADEKDDASLGMRLAKEHGVTVAPFFLVGEVGEVRVYDSAIKLAKEVLSSRKASTSESATVLESGSIARSKAQAGAARGEPSGKDAASPMWDEARVTNEASRLSQLSPREVIEFALSHAGAHVSLAFSGAEDVALIDMAVKTGLPFSVFCLDTGRLHPETYRFIELVRVHYGIELELLSPHHVAVDALVRKKGLFSFYEEGHQECCGIRKIEPLRRALQNVSCWITGQRRDQSPTRSDVPVIDWDRVHRPEGLLKFNPLAAISQEEVWRYIRDNDVPYNPLHDAGYISIGCEPCTRASRPGEHERAARWWWEDATRRECGLHAR